MNIVTIFDDLQLARNKLINPLGLVPTMGALHAGHLSLIRRAREECQSTAVSIFVNPTQFAPLEDLKAYPRDVDRDLGLLEKEHVDLVWIPDAEELYPAHFQTWVEVDQLTKVLEGGFRPGHFRGVTTIVSKLFNAFQPQKAYFGQKDAQQTIVIQRMVKDLNYALEIVVCRTIREPDGLAISSRNAHLDPEQRKAASVLFQALSAAEKAFNQGRHDAEQLRQIMREILEMETQAEVQYVSVANPTTLEELDGNADRALLSTAVLFGKTRLIDNVMVKNDKRLLS